MVYWSVAEISFKEYISIFSSGGHFGPVVQEEMSFKRFLIWSSGGPPVLGSVNIYVIYGSGDVV